MIWKFVLFYNPAFAIEETCRKIWLQLRRSYANEKRQQKQNPGARTTRNCKYRRYFDAMKFLDGIMEEEFARYLYSLPVIERMCIMGRCVKINFIFMFKVGSVKLLRILKIIKVFF